MAEPMSEWESLPGGDELDRLIAERLGYRVTEGTTQDRYGSIPMLFYVARGHETPQILPAYSADLNAAIDLLEQMSMHTIGSLYFDEEFEETRLWTCNVFMDGPGDIANGEADTPALAICRAFLSWQDAKDSTGTEAG